MGRISIIAAVSDNNVIGRDNDLPWHLSSDLKRLKSLTMGHHLIMGRRTWQSVGKPLPGRTIVVVTHKDDVAMENVVTAPTVEKAIEIAQGDDEVFIAGGATIYEQTIHFADRMYLTRVHAEVEGDTFFPEFDDVTEWKLVDSEHFEADEKNDHPFSYLTYERIAPARNRGEVEAG
jgi:dihydrofolate reductase